MVVIHENLSLAFSISVTELMVFSRNIFKAYTGMFVFDLGCCHDFSQLVPANILTHLTGVRVEFYLQNCPHNIKKLAYCI